MTSAPANTDTAFDPDALEAARVLFARPAVFMMGAAQIDGLPPADLPEVAFAGRSNVGKSSLINALVGQHRLARASNEPGRTREVNFFVLDERLRLVDLPGYGFAKASKTATNKFQNLARAYLRGRPNLKRVYLLIDGRHGLKAVDGEALDALDEAAVSYQIVLTKADKLKPAEVAAVVEAHRPGHRQAPGRLPARHRDLGRKGRRPAAAAGGNRRGHRLSAAAGTLVRGRGQVSARRNRERLLYRGTTPHPALSPLHGARVQEPAPMTEPPPSPDPPTKSRAGQPPRPWPKPCLISRSTTVRRW